MPPYRAAFITGASSGIGWALSRALAAAGTHVVLAARREAKLEALRTEIAAAGGSARVLPLDVRDTERTVAVVQELDEQLGLDLVVANAGVGVGDRRAPPYAWEAVGAACHLNFTGAVATLTAPLPRWVARGAGHAVAIGSLASFGPLPGSAAYCAPKAGLSMFVDCLRLDLAGTGVAVTTVHAGFVRTPMTAETTHPMPWQMNPDEAARIIVSRLPARPANITFPAPLAFAARVVGRLPRPLRDRLLGRLRSL